MIVSEKSDAQFFCLFVFVGKGLHSGVLDSISLKLGWMIDTDHFFILAWMMVTFIKVRGLWESENFSANQLTKFSSDFKFLMEFDILWKFVDLHFIWSYQH